jgi:hypothetical protein
MNKQHTPINVSVRQQNLLHSDFAGCTRTVPNKNKIFKTHKYFFRQQYFNDKRHVFVTPVSTQNSSNVTDSIMKHEPNIDFLKSLMSRQDYKDLNCLCAMNHLNGIHPTHFEGLFTSLVVGHVSEWQKLQQDFLFLSREEKAVQLKKDPKLRFKIIQLTRFLESRQVLNLRKQFPCTTEENIVMCLRQNHQLSKVEELLTHRMKLLNQPVTNESVIEEDNHCITCCEEVDCIVYSCGHRCCCADCSKQLSKCPICRCLLKQTQ